MDPFSIWKCYTLFFAVNCISLLARVLARCNSREGGRGELLYAFTWLSCVYQSTRSLRLSLTCDVLLFGDAVANVVSIGQQGWCSCTTVLHQSAGREERRGTVQCLCVCTDSVFCLISRATQPQWFTTHPPGSELTAAQSQRKSPIQTALWGRFLAIGKRSLLQLWTTLGSRWRARAATQVPSGFHHLVQHQSTSPA